MILPKEVRLGRCNLAAEAGPILGLTLTLMEDVVRVSALLQ
jgi:hypothetical protein